MNVKDKKDKMKESEKEKWLHKTINEKNELKVFRYWQKRMRRDKGEGNEKIKKRWKCWKIKNKITWMKTEK